MPADRAPDHDPPPAPSGARGSGLLSGTRVGRVAGVDLRVHWSTLLIFGLLVSSLASVRLPEQAPGASDGAYLAAALAAGVAFYLALLAHEVSHAVMARRHGIEVRSLTLWLLGGIATLEGEPRTPKADLRIAGIGPAVSLAIAAAAAGLAWLLDGVGASELVVTTIAWLAGINAILGVFNLIPAAPLDGGRILRAALWAWRGDRTDAAVSAARAGEAFGYGLGALGLLSLFVPTGVGGLWLILLGWFIVNAARSEQEQTVLLDALGEVTVAHAMTSDPVTAPADASVDRVLEDLVFGTRHSAFPIVDRAGRPVGLVTLGHLRQVAAEDRASVTASDVGCGPDDVVRVSPSDRLADVLPRLNRCAEGRALVVDGDRLVGLLTKSDVTRILEAAPLRTR